MIGYKSKYWEIKECYAIVCDITAFSKTFRFKIITVQHIRASKSKDHFDYTEKYSFHNSGFTHKSNLFRTKSAAIAEMKKKLKAFYLENLAYINKIAKEVTGCSG